MTGKRHWDRVQLGCNLNLYISEVGTTNTLTEPLSARPKGLFSTPKEGIVKEELRVSVNYGGVWALWGLMVIALIGFAVFALDLIEGNPQVALGLLPVYFLSIGIVAFFGYYLGIRGIIEQERGHLRDLLALLTNEVTELPGKKGRQLDGWRYYTDGTSRACAVKLVRINEAREFFMNLFYSSPLLVRCDREALHRRLVWVLRNDALVLRVECMLMALGELGQTGLRVPTIMPLERP